MPQEGHAGRKVTRTCVSRPDAVRPSGGGEGAVVPQLPLPPASGLLSCSGLQAHTPFEAGRVAARHKRGPRFRGDGNGRRFHFIPRVRPRQTRVRWDDARRARRDATRARRPMLNRGRASLPLAAIPEGGIVPPPPLARPHRLSCHRSG
jgi:hypothetical protein